MSQPHKCPVCLGAGQVDRSLYEPGDSTAIGPRLPCRSCNGTGVVWDHFTAPTFVPVPAPYFTPPYKVEVDLTPKVTCGGLLTYNEGSPWPFAPILGDQDIQNAMRPTILPGEKWRA